MPFKGSVLVVDPCAPVAQFIAEALEDAGYVVLLAHDRASLYIALAANRPDLLLYAADGLNGMQSAVLDSLRILTGTRVPIILMTTGTSSPNPRGISASLRKPFSLEELEA